MDIVSVRADQEYICISYGVNALHISSQNYNTLCKGIKKQKEIEIERGF